MGRAAGFLVVLGCLFACGDDDAPPTNDAGVTYPSESKSLGPAGGDLTLADGAKLVVPAGALNATVTISLREIPGDSVAPLPTYMEPGGKTYALEPFDVVFTLPVEVTLPMTGDTTETRPMKLTDLVDTSWQTIVGAQKTENDLVLETVQLGVFVPARPRRNSGVGVLPDGAIFTLDAGSDAGQDAGQDGGQDATTPVLDGSLSDAATEDAAAEDAATEDAATDPDASDAQSSLCGNGVVDDGEACDNDDENLCSDDCMTSYVCAPGSDGHADLLAALADPACHAITLSDETIDGPIAPTRDVVITGTRPGTILRSATNAPAITVASDTRVELRDLAIEGIPGATDGCIASAGELVLHDVTISGCRRSEGAAIVQTGGSLSITGASHIHSNESGVGGGGTTRGGAITGTNTTIEIGPGLLINNNTAGGRVIYGGAIYVTASTLGIHGATITNNRITPDTGGGVEARGGGVFAVDSSVTLDTGSSVSANSIVFNADALTTFVSSTGGGIELRGGSLNASVASISNNFIGTTISIGGTSISSHGSGGGIACANLGVITLGPGTTVADNVIDVTGSTSMVDASGGGINVYDCGLTLDRVSVRGNAVRARGTVVASSGATGGGIGLYRGQQVVHIQDSDVTDNTLLVTTTGTAESGHNEARGGGIFTNESNLQLLRTTIDDNAVTIEHTDPNAVASAALAYGGGLCATDANTAPESIVQLDACTVAGNSMHVVAAGNNNMSVGGGGLAVFGGYGSSAGHTVDIVNTTISSNTMTLEQTGTGQAHTGATGVHVIEGSQPLGVHLRNVTVAHNTAISPTFHTGSGVYAAPNTGVTLSSVLLAGNGTDTGTFEAIDCIGQAMSLGHNVVENAGSCTIASTGDVTGTPADINALADNGPTRTPPMRTHTLTTDSPARDAGPVAGCTRRDGTPLTTDQRGQPRQDTRCDVGAVEM